MSDSKKPRNFFKDMLLRMQALLGRTLERLPSTWNHVIDKESLKFKELEHVRLEKAEQLF